MKLTVKKLKEMIREAVVVAATAEPSSSSDTPGMFPGMSDVGLGTEEGGSAAIPSCKNTPETVTDNSDDTSKAGLKDVVKTVISNFVMEHSKKTGRKTK